MTDTATDSDQATPDPSMGGVVSLSLDVPPDIGARVCKVIAETICVEEEEVTLDLSLIDDLGVESLDFLEMVFHLDHAFDIEITNGALERAARGDMSNEEFATPSGVIREAGLARLRILLPESAERIKPGLYAQEILRLFTPRTMARIVLAQLNKKSGEE